MLTEVGSLLEKGLRLLPIAPAAGVDATLGQLPALNHIRIGRTRRTKDRPSRESWGACCVRDWK